MDKNGVFNQISSIFTSSNPPLTYNDNNVEKEVEYKYYVTAVHSFGESEPSNTAETIFQRSSSDISVTTSNSSKLMWLLPVLLSLVAIRRRRI